MKPFLHVQRPYWGTYSKVHARDFWSRVNGHNNCLGSVCRYILSPFGRILPCQLDVGLTCCFGVLAQAMNPQLDYALSTLRRCSPVVSVDIVTTRVHKTCGSHPGVIGW